MQITVVGAGAIGGIVSAYLARSGREVLVVDSAEEHVAAINRDGLLVDGLRGEFRVRVPTITPEELPDRLELVLLCTKAQHTAISMAPVVDRLDPNGVVVSLQNGLNELYLSQLLGSERTVGAFLNWGGDYQAPGHVRFGIEGSFYLGELDGRESERVHEIASMLSVISPAQVTSNIWGYLWSKEALGAVLFATALVDADVADLLKDDRYRKLMVSIAREGVALARVLGIRLQPFDGFEPDLMQPGTPAQMREASASLEAMGENYWRHLKRRSGVWRDLAVRRRPTEVDYMVGAMLEEGERVGHPMPLCRAIVQMIHQVEQGGRPMDMANLDELDALGRKEYPALYSL